MPIKINDVVIMGDDGKFTPEFNPGLLGDDYKDSKFLETTPDLVSLMKAGIDTKSALGKKLESHIAPLGENPSEEEVATHRKSLMAGLGTVVENADGYELGKPEDWPEGIPFDEETTKHFADYLFSKGYPKEMVRELVSEYNGVVLKRFEEFARDEQEGWDKDVRELKSDWKGATLIKKARTAAKAMLQFATDELVGEIKKADLVTTPDDFGKWQALGMTAAQIRVWNNIGEKMKSDKAITDEGISEADKKGDQKGKLSRIYDHATSQDMT